LLDSWEEDEDALFKDRLLYAWDPEVEVDEVGVVDELDLEFSDLKSELAMRMSFSSNYINALLESLLWLLGPAFSAFINHFLKCFNWFVIKY
jgi:hypothetical protein